MKSKAASTLPDLPLSSEVARALDYALCATQRWVVDRRIYVERWDGPILRLEQYFVGVSLKIGSGPLVFQGYDVANENIDLVLSLAAAEPTVAKAMYEYLSQNVLRGWPIPEGLRGTAALMLTGRSTLTKPRNRKPSEIHRDTLLVGLAKRIGGDCGLPVGSSNDAFKRRESKPISGSTIAAAALHAFGIEVSAERASSIVHNRSNLVLKEMLEEEIFAPRMVAWKGKGPCPFPTAPIPALSYDVSLLQKERARALDWLAAPV